MPTETWIIPLFLLSLLGLILLSLALFTLYRLRAEQPALVFESLRNDTRALRDELRQTLGEHRRETHETLDRLRQALNERLDGVTKSQVELATRTTTVLAQGLRDILDRNEAKLEQMRLTVDEKLQKTLETRLGQSFETVTRQLLAVQKGLTEMQTLAQDVGGLKKALTNVKVRGLLGEAQLGALLEQYLAPDQFVREAVVRPRSQERVEFAVKLPGPDDNGPLLLPIDSKFPIEDYQRLQEAYEAGKKDEWEAAGKAFENRLYFHAKEIRDKYLAPPQTTDFALMFLPFESIYAEALRRPSLFAQIQRTLKITLVGPTTLSAFLNSLQVGFKTLAISRQSGEVWKVLGNVKTEFGKFGEVLNKVQTNLEHATANIQRVSDRARQMEKKLDKVATLDSDTENLLADDLI